MRGSETVLRVDSGCVCACQGRRQTGGQSAESHDSFPAAACPSQSKEGWALATPVWPDAPFHASLVPGTQDPSLVLQHSSSSGDDKINNRTRE